MKKDKDKKDPNSLLMPQISMGDSRSSFSKRPRSPSLGKRFETLPVSPIESKKIKAHEEQQTSAATPSKEEPMTSKNYVEVYKKREKARQQLAQDKAKQAQGSTSAQETKANEQRAHANNIRDQLGYWQRQQDAPDGTHTQETINNMVDTLKRQLASIPYSSGGNG